jgi:hypothetical protein
MPFGEIRLQGLRDDRLSRRFTHSLDENRVTELFRRDSQPVFRPCDRFFRDPTAAGEATRETFLRTCQKLNRFMACEQTRNSLIGSGDWRR